MVNYETVFEHWQALLAPYQSCFTTPGWFRFCQWTTGMALCLNEHWLTQTLVSLGKEEDFMALSAFSEKGAWRKERVEKIFISQVTSAKREKLEGYLFTFYATEKFNYTLFTKKVVGRRLVRSSRVFRGVKNACKSRSFNAR